jgi:LPXTG-motif cell wall-anchored protein
LLLSRATGRLARTAAALLVTGVVVVGLPKPAVAAEKYVGLTAGLGGQSLAIGTSGKGVPVWYGAYSVGGATLPDTVTLKLDISGAAADVVTAQFADPKPAGCSVAGAVFTCAKAGNRASEVQGDFTLVFKAASGAKVGDRASVKLTLSAPGVDTKTLSQDLTISQPGPDLFARDFTRTTNPGGTIAFKPAFFNHGDKRAETVVLSLYAEPFAQYTDKFSNCRYAPDATSHPDAVCFFKNLNVEPGEIITASTDLSAKVSADIPGRTFVSYSADVYSNDTTISGPWDQWPAGNGAALGWERTQTGKDTTSDVDYVDNQGSVRITTSANPSDVVANGATTTGKVGDTVTVKLGLTNKGPGFINGISDSETSNPEDPYNAAFVAKFPAGVEITKIENPDGDGKSCRGIVNGTVDEDVNKPGRLEYRCMAWHLAVNETHTVTFTVKITGSVSTAGSIVARGGSSDPNTANNTAKIEFTGQDGLPITGMNVGLVAAVGAGLLAAGLALLFLTRRRRSESVTE